MISPLDTLIGATVVQVETLHDYVQVCFEGDRILTIFNELEAREALPQLIHGLVGAHLAKAEEGKGKLVLGFDNDTELAVNMSDEAYRGPEAMHLIRPGQPIVVW